MKAFITILVFGISIGVSAQSKKAEKLHRLFENDKIEKSEKLANKMLSKDRNDEDALFILAFIHLEEAKSSNSNPSRKRLIKNSIDKMDRIPNHNGQYYRQVNDSIHSYILTLLENENLKSSYSKSYIKLLAKEFNDTLAEYRIVFKSENKKASKRVVYEAQDSLRNVMLQVASQLQGTPYKWAGSTPKTGFDCSGFTMYVYKSIGIELPHNAQKQSELIEIQKPIEDAIPGDLIFFGSKNKKTFSTQHAGIIYSIDGEDIQVIHCVSNGVNIDGENSSWEHYWKEKVLFVVDVLSYNEMQNEN